MLASWRICESFGYLSVPIRRTSASKFAGQRQYANEHCALCVCMNLNACQRGDRVSHKRLIKLGSQKKRKKKEGKPFQESLLKCVQIVFDWATTKCSLANERSRFAFLFFIFSFYFRFLFFDNFSNTITALTNSFII